MSKETILGYSVDTESSSSCADEILKDCIGESGRRWLACLNPHSYAVARRDPEFRAALNGADYLVPDGIGVVLASRILGKKIQNRVTGFEIFDSVHKKMNERGGMKVFFLGSTEGTLQAIRTKMQDDFPNVIVAGTHSPPYRKKFSEQEMTDMIGAVNAVSPDVLWVGMTAPKQEKWVFEAIERLDVKFAAAIGAVFDFYVGNIQRSHPYFQSLGLEWLPRLLREPRRLWTRTFVSAPIFLWDLIRERLAGRSDK